MILPVGGAETGEDPLLSIGQLARRSRLSMKALRLHDRLGLLTPDHVDPDSGYRRYRESQLSVARLVVMLRRLDMLLAQVAAAPKDSLAASPREIYFTDFVAAAPGDEVCDVAFPLRD